MNRQHNQRPVDEHVRSHPHYDFDMEVLATLPVLGSTWTYVAHGDIAWDHRLKTQKPVAEAIARLNASFKIRSWNTNGQRVSALYRASWKEAKAAAESYWERAHGE